MLSSKMHRPQRKKRSSVREGWMPAVNYLANRVVRSFTVCCRLVAWRGQEELESQESTIVIIPVVLVDVCAIR